MLGDQPFQRQTFNGLGTVQRAGRAQRAVNSGIEIMNATWNGIERRGKPKALQDFTSRQAVFETLMAAVAAAHADGDDMIANRYRWQEVGDYVQAAAQRAEILIRAVNPDRSPMDYAMACRTALAREAERFLDDDSDAASFYGPTLHGIIRSIEAE